MAYDHLEIEARWGTILGEDNERMSKSRGNVVNPEHRAGVRRRRAPALRDVHGAARGREALADLADPGRKWLWAALALVGSNFLGNSWVDADPQGFTHLKGLPARAVAPEVAGPY
jgi:valyl-tRNA synthetase